MSFDNINIFALLKDNTMYGPEGIQALIEEEKKKNPPQNGVVSQVREFMKGAFNGLTSEYDPNDPNKWSWAPVEYPVNYE